MQHPRHGETTPSGYQVGTLIEARLREDGAARYAVIVPPPAEYAGRDVARRPWGSHWADSAGQALDRHRRDPLARPQYTSRPDIRIVRAADINTEEGSTTMTETIELNWKGEDLRPSQRITSWVPGTEYRLIYPGAAHQFELVVRATSERTELRNYSDLRGEVVRWVHENRTFNERSYPAGSDWTASFCPLSTMSAYNFILPVDSSGPEDEGSWVQATEAIPEGTRFRYYWSDQTPGSERFAYAGEMLNWGDRRVRLTEHGEYDSDPIGYEGTLDLDSRVESYYIWVPATFDTDWRGQRGTFEPHGAIMPQRGSTVRGIVSSNSTREVEGLFIEVLDSGTARIERKRKRTVNADGTRGEWENYSSAGRVTVNVEGATVFTPRGMGAPVLVRGGAITNSGQSLEVQVGTILSAREKYGNGRIAWRGEVTQLRDGEYGEYTILATEKAEFGSSADTSGAYNWTKLVEPRSVDVVADWSSGRSGYNTAGYIWTLTTPSAVRVDPAYDPTRKTRFTGLKIGDLVVARLTRGGRDTVSSWVKGEIVKWDLRESSPVVKVTDKMESSAKVGDEVTVIGDDTYPAMADPAAVSPEEFKKTLRAYLIGRHKRGDFCQGGLNTMLAAHGIPLYETRRVAKMALTITYDPNVTDLYQVREHLHRGMEGVSSLDMSERSAEDIEVESDVTGG